MRQLFLNIRNWWRKRAAIRRNCPEGHKPVSIQWIHHGSRFGVGDILFARKDAVSSFSDTSLKVISWHGLHYFFPTQREERSRRHYNNGRILTGRVLSLRIIGTDGRWRYFEPPYSGHDCLDEWHAYDELFWAWATGQINGKTFDIISKLLQKQKLMLEGLEMITYSLDGLAGSGSSFRALHAWIQSVVNLSEPGPAHIDELDVFIHTPPDIGGRHQVKVEA